MAKRKPRASSKPVAVIDERPVEAAPIQIEKKEEPQPAPQPPPAPTIIIDKCGSCGVERRICYYDSDRHWELPGHPDHFSRPICGECVTSELRRNDCCVAVYEAMRKKLGASGMPGYEIEEAVHTAWRTFCVSYDNEALIELAKRLKVKADWLKRK